MSVIESETHILFRSTFPQYEIPEENILHNSNVETHYGKYSVVEMGILKSYKAEVAIKTFRDPDPIKENILYEFYTYQSINNKFCLPIFGYVNNSDGSISFITPWMRNGTLESQLNKLNPSQKTMIAAGIAQGLSIVLPSAQSTILHFEESEKNHCIFLSPSNILLSDDMMPQISSFGFIDGNKDIRYTLPNIEKYEEDFCESPDVYSFGLIMNDMVSGRRPFDGMNDVQIQKAIQNGDKPEIDSKTPGKLREIIKSCIKSKDPDQMNNIYQRFEQKEVYYEGTDYSKIPNLKSEPKDYDELLTFLRSMFENLEINNTELSETEKATRGGFSKVYFGKWRNKDIALKVFNSMTAKEIWREVSTMISLENPFSMKVFGYICYPEDQEIGIVMPKMNGGCLENHLRLNRKETLENQKLNGTQKTFIAAAIAHVMSRLHESDFIHLDLKTENILLNENMWPYLSDFGSLKHCKTQAVNPKVTVEYTAPEILGTLNPCLSCTKKADVYSYGIILNEIYTQEKPFKEVPYHSIRYLISTGQKPHISPKTPKELLNLINQCLDIHPYSRPSFTAIYTMFISHQVFYPDTNFDELDELLKKASIEKIDNIIRLSDIIKSSDDSVRVTGSPQSINMYIERIDVTEASEDLTQIQNFLYNSMYNKKAPLEISDQDLAIIYDIILKIYGKGPEFAKLCSITNIQSCIRFVQSTFQKALEIYKVSADYNPEDFLLYPKKFKRIDVLYEEYPEQVISVYGKVLEYYSRNTSKGKGPQLLRLFLQLINKFKVNKVQYNLIFDILLNLTKKKHKELIYQCNRSIKNKAQMRHVIVYTTYFPNNPSFAVAYKYLVDNMKNKDQIFQDILTCCKNDESILTGVIEISAISPHMNVLKYLLANSFISQILDSMVFEIFSEVSDAVDFALYVKQRGYDEKLISAKGFMKRLAEVYAGVGTEELGQRAIPLIQLISRVMKTTPKLNINEMSEEMLITKFCEFIVRHAGNKELLKKGHNEVAKILTSNRFTKDMNGAINLVVYILQNKESSDGMKYNALIIMKRLLECEDVEIVSDVIGKIRKSNLHLILGELKTNRDEEYATNVIINSIIDKLNYE